MTIAVTGATGTVGVRLVARLTGRGHRVRALVRPGGRRPAGDLVEAVPADLERPETLREALSGITDLFLLTPLHPDQGSLHRGLVDVAKRAGVEHVVRLSAFGADPASPVLIHRQHGEGDQAVIESGLRYTLLRPNAFMQNAVQWAHTIKARDTIVLPVGPAKVSMIDAGDIAEVAAVALTESGTDYRSLDLTGPRAISYATAAAIVSTVVGRHITHVEIAPDEAGRVMAANGVPEWAITARLGLYETLRAGEAEHVTTTVADWTGRQPRDFAEVAPDLAAALRDG
ncbi:SDR family oxidoreductase [Actinokineospora globicatena]|uniref:Nucleotide-diphosphate-sugar epimerase n=1 Tax=Actinokineospora globicatena TaxID=103729 RepID=A0A9W6QRP4_9PSEU|nr:SDR family oxidoreductase [Actinokineospora globicatena]GLW93369.1 nucleotide-diphosphate-sugar epimerase [Actinokineospora globicatena]